MGDLSQGPEPSRLARARCIVAASQSVRLDWLQVYPNTFVSGTVDADARVPGR